MSELAEKRRRVHELLEREDLDELILRRPGKVARYSGGGRTNVLAMQDVGVADLVITRDADEVFTAVNEAARLEAEELSSLGASFRVLGWDEDRTAVLPRGPRVGCDTPLEGRRDVATAVEEVRRALTPDEVERFRALGRDAALAMTEACHALRPRDDEARAAATLARALVERDADPVVLLVAGEDRLPRHRHPLPTRAPLGGLAMLVACARRGGLIASLTRFVAFRSLPAQLRDAHERLLRVDVAFNLATSAGATVGEVFRAGTSAYEASGFAPEEWRLHHQGGPTGYEPRDYLATAASAALVEDREAFAWNPSVPSLKSEDTVLASPSGPEILTVDPAWPSVRVDGLERPLVLEV